MADKNVLQARVSHMHDVEENWLKTTNFIPRIGEVIVYDNDDKHPYERFKIGDGVTDVNSLKFSMEETLKSQLGYVKNLGYILDAGRITDY